MIEIDLATIEASLRPEIDGHIGSCLQRRAIPNSLRISLKIFEGYTYTVIEA